MNYHISCGIGRADMIYHYHSMVYVAVPCRNQLFRCVFQSHRCVQSALSLNFVKGGTHTCFIDSLAIHASTKCMSPALNGSSAIRHSDAIKLHVEIIFNFYTGPSYIMPNCEPSMNVPYVSLRLVRYPLPCDTAGMISA